MRSLTGEGARKTHRALSEIFPLEHIEVPSGTEVFDWTVPPEWSVKEAYLTDPDGQRVVDITENPLHLVNYSEPFSGKVNRAELEKHLYSDPERPETIPYITSYYSQRWGFCLPHSQRLALQDGDYEVNIDTNLFPGSMILSQALIPGETEKEVIISSYTCHPGMANDEICAPIAMAILARRIATWPNRRLTFRFLFAPETIGSLAFLSMYFEHWRKNLLAGYVVANIGYDDAIYYKKSKSGDSLADRIVSHIFGKRSDVDLLLREFFPSGSDERQYNSPGFNLPIGRLSRSELPFPNYHCSADSIDTISEEAVIQTIDYLEQICRTLNGNATYRNLKPYGEPQLGKYGLYPTIGEIGDRTVQIYAIKCVLSFSDGEHDLLSISQRSGIDFDELREAAERCSKAGLLEAIDY